MRLDLSFQDPAAEDEFRRGRLALLRPYVQLANWVRLLMAAFLAARLALLREWGSVATVALTCVVVAHLLMAGREELWLRYVATVVFEGLLLFCGFAVVPHVCWSGGHATPALALARPLVELLSMSGVPWPLFTVASSPLPFRLLYPLLVAESAGLLLHAPHMCARPDLRHACLALHSGLLRALRATRLLPAGTAVAVPSAEAAHALCAAAYQPALTVLGNALAGHVAFSTELAQRRAFVQRRGAAGGGALLTMLRASGRLPVVAADYWLQFALPAAAALASLHLCVLQLRA